MHRPPAYAPMCLQTITTYACGHKHTTPQDVLWTCTCADFDLAKPRIISGCTTDMCGICAPLVPRFLRYLIRSWSVAEDEK